ncbi:hypothetical protein [Novipirellula herctigrandis]
MKYAPIMGMLSIEPLTGLLFSDDHCQSSAKRMPPRVASLLTHHQPA